MAESALHTALKDELASLEKVIILLKQEQDLLARARIDELAALTQTKISAVAQLELLSASRKAHMSALDIPDNGSAISAWLGKHDSLALESWETLIEMAKKAAQYNRSNSQLLASREDANRSLMNILISQQEAETAYTADGLLSHGGATRRKLDRA